MGKSTTPRVQGANKGHSYPRLFTKAAFVGYTRNLANQKCNNHLLELDGVKDATASRFYCGKRVAYVYKGKSVKGKRRVIWGKICRPHGQSGLVRAKFAKNLPGQALGKIVRVMLYPSNV